MRSLLYQVTILFAIAICWYLPGIAQNDSGATVKVVYTEGTVRVQKPGSEGWLEADSGAVLSDGDKISTGESSRAILEFLDGQVMRLGPRTILSFTSAGGYDSLSTASTSYPGPGDVWVNFGPQDPVDSMPAARSITCANHFKEGLALVAPLLDSLPAIFRMEVGSDSTFELKVYRGLLYLTFEGLAAEIDSLNPLKYPEYKAPKVYGDVRLEEHTVVVQSYQKLILTSRGELVSKSAFAPTDPDEQIDWVAWNRSLDEKIR